MTLLHAWRTERLALVALILRRTIARMTLVVAHVAGAVISLCCDSMITFGYDEESRTWDEDKTREVFTRAVPKILLLRSDLVVGMSGADLPWAARELTGMRDAPVDDVLEVLQEFDEVEFVAGVPQPERPRLWRARRGSLREYTDEHRTWVGDQDAYETYLGLYAKFPDGFGDLRMVSSMQGVVHIFRSPGVGGFIMQVATGPAGFCLASMPTVVAGGSPAGLGQTDAFAVLAGAAHLAQRLLDRAGGGAATDPRSGRVRHPAGQAGLAVQPRRTVGRQGVAGRLRAGAHGGGRRTRPDPGRVAVHGQKEGCR